MGKSIAILLLIFIIDISSTTNAFYIVAHGGFCATYESDLPGNLITFKRCELGNPKQVRWNFLPTGIVSSDPILMCIGNSEICDQVGDDGREYLAIKNVTNPAQYWTKIIGNRFTNGLTGPNFCSQTIYNPDGDRIPGYNQQMPCSNDPSQIYHLFSLSSGVASYFGCAGLPYSRMTHES